MTDANHEKKIKKVEAEIVELRKQIMQIEFISKTDTAAARQEHEAARKEFDRTNNIINRQIQHLSRLMGITYDELDLFDGKVQESGRVLGQPRKHSTLA